MANLRQQAWNQTATIARLTSELAALRTELDRLHSLPDDLRTCGEISGDDCNARVVGLRTELAEARAERDESVEHGTAGWARVAESAHELGELRGTVIGLREQLAEARAEVHSVRSTLCERANQILEQSAELADLRKRWQEVCDFVFEVHGSDIKHAFGPLTFDRHEKLILAEMLDLPDSSTCHKEQVAAARREQSATAKGDE